MNEKRKNGRASTHCPVVVKLLTIDGKPQRDAPPYYCHAADLSTTGIRLVLSTDLPVDAMLELVIVMLDPPATFRHLGVVRWISVSADTLKKFSALNSRRRRRT